MLGFIEFLILIAIIWFVVNPYFKKQDQQLKGKRNHQKVSSSDEDSYEEIDYEDVESD